MSTFWVACMTIVFHILNILVKSQGFYILKSNICFVKMLNNYHFDLNFALKLCWKYFFQNMSIIKISNGSKIPKIVAYLICCPDCMHFAQTNNAYISGQIIYWTANLKCFASDQTLWAEEYQNKKIIYKFILLDGHHL